MFPGSGERLLDLFRLPACRALVAVLPAGEPAFVVGGAVRDALLDRPTRDLDLLVLSEGRATATALAAKLGARLVDLGARRFASWRCVLPDGGVVDLWQADDHDLERELGRRDLTVNALALDLHDASLHDPWGGREDLEQGLLRTPRPENLTEDPLRVLRLVRFLHTLPAARLERRTRQAARAAAAAIAGVAGERVRDEWLALARATGPENPPLRSLATSLADLDLHPRLWGEGGLRDTALTARCGALEAVLGELSVAAPLDLPPPEPLEALDGLLFDALADRDGGMRRAAGLRYRSRGELHRLQRALALSSLPVDEAEGRRFLHRLGDLAPLALALHLALERPPAATRRPILARLQRLAREHGETLRRLPRLLDGREVARLTGRRGPALGEALRLLQEAQILGQVHDAEDARRLLAGLPPPDDRRPEGAP